MMDVLTIAIAAAAAITALTSAIIVARALARVRRLELTVARLSASAAESRRAPSVEPSPAPAPAPSPVRSRQPEPAPKGPAARRVLVVEDNEINQRMMHDYLAAHGFEVATAGNGQDAIERARGFVPDVILMDVHMPVMDGLEATRRIKADPSLAHIPIVGVTALASSRDRELCLEAGCDEHVPKPVSPRAVVQVVTRLCGCPVDLQPRLQFAADGGA